MNKQRALEILRNAIVSYEMDLENANYGGEEEAHDILLNQFSMTQEEYDYVFSYNMELTLRNNLSRSLGGAEFISDDEEE